MGIIINPQHNKIMANVIVPMDNQLGLTWELVGKDGNADVTWPKSSDGYEVNAGFHWKAAEEDSEAETTGTYAACVKAFDMDGAEMNDGSPVICHVLNMDGATATGAAVHLMTNEEFLAIGETVPGTALDVNIDACKLGFGCPEEVAEEGDEEEGDEGEEEEEEAGEDEETEEAGDDEADDAFQGDDDWGDDVSDAVGDAQDAVDETVDDAGDAVDEGTDLVDEGSDAVDGAMEEGNDYAEEGQEKAEAVVEAWSAPSAAWMVANPEASVNARWFQPKMAKSYDGLRRFGSGSVIQAYSVAPGEDGVLAVSEVNGKVALLGAQMLAAGAIALGTITLTM